MTWLAISLHLLPGFLLAMAGGDLFVRGILGGSAVLRLAPALVGLTLAAFATSAPELAVGLLSAAEGKSDLSLGNVLGSSVINLGLVLGGAALLGGLHGGGIRRGRTFPFALAAWPVLLIAGWDGEVTRVESIALLAVFAIWLLSALLDALNVSGEEVKRPRTGKSLWKPALQLIGGAALLLGAAQLIVRGGTGAAERLGVAPLLIGATLISLGTTVPELVTTLVARLKGHAEVGLGTVLGSNLFNLLLVAGMVAAIRPVPVERGILVPACAFGLLMTLLVLPGASGRLGRWRGFALVGLYVAFAAYAALAGYDLARGS